MELDWGACAFIPTNFSSILTYWHTHTHTHSNTPDTITTGPVCFSSTPIEGFAKDYAFIIQGLIDAYEASFKDHLIEWAEKLQRKMDELFWDGESGGYFTSRTDDCSVLLKIKDGKY